MKRWSADEMVRLRELFPMKKLKELSEEFGRSIGSISQKANELGIKGKGYAWRKVRLTREEKLWLRLNYPHMSNEICAIRIGCGWRTVVRIARMMGLEKTPQFMKECQAHTAKKAKDSHLKNGTYPPKGWYSPNLQKGEKYKFGIKKDESNTTD